MDRDTEQLNLLAIFHYVVAGLAAIFSFFPLLYTAVGVIFIFAARHGTAKPGEELPPEFLGWIFAVLGSVLFVIGIAMAICILIAGRSLALRKRYSFALVIACIECLFVPFGTILGVFTIIVLLRESGESVVCGNADVSLKIASGRRRRNLSYRRRINSHCGNLEKAQCNSRQSVLAARAYCPPVPNPVCEALLSCSCRSASALPLFTFKAPAFVVPLSSTSTQLPPI